MITAEQLIKKDESGIFNEQDIAHMMIEFAKLHLTAQQKALEQNIRTTKDGLMYVDADNISSSYSLTNIK